MIAITALSLVYKLARPSMEAHDPFFLQSSDWTKDYVYNVEGANPLYCL